ncbi:RES family NAD+ phosphorylase [Vibrio sp. WJH972]
MGITKVIKGFRLINTQYPAIAIFDDVADKEEFDALYAIQAITNPRLKDQVGDISLIDKQEIPFHCKRNRSYAVAPFTHINPVGGRFNDGLFGALYFASNDETAVVEVRHHQQQYWSGVVGLKYDRFLFRGLRIESEPESVHIVQDSDTSILDPDFYAASQQLARELKTSKVQCIQYPSVRSNHGICWALLTPKPVTDIVQSYLLEMIWDGEKISEVNKVSKIN